MTTVSTRPFLKQHYGPSEGPLGFPQTDKQALALEALLKSLPTSDEFRYRKAIVEKATTELSPGERADVSWISTEDPDRTGEVVMARGMNDSQFTLNPLVTLNHCYWAPPAGRSLWRKRVRASNASGAHSGIKAKTHYPSLPKGWPDSKDWVPDVVFMLVQAGLLRGKSIGFLPTKVHTPNDQERDRQGWRNVSLVIDEWILLEYACVFLPAQQNAVVEEVSKSMPLSAELLYALGLDLAAPASPPVPEAVPHCRLETIEQALFRAVANLDVILIAEKSIQNQLDRLQGRIG